MYKNIALCFMISFLLVYPAEASLSPHTGFSIGHNFGHGSIAGKLNNDLTTSGGSLTGNDIGAHSSVFGFFLGYGWSPKIEGIYFGYEIFYQHENIKLQYEIVELKMIFKKNNSFGSASKIGFLYKDALFFLKTGIVSLGNKSQNASERNTGFIVGIGADYAIDNNWSLGAEFIYEMYSYINLVLPEEGIISYRPTKYTSNIRLKYTF